MAKQYTDEEITRARKELGITTPYWARVVGSRIEFTVPSQHKVLIWPPNQAIYSNSTKTELQTMADMLDLHYTTKTTKKELIAMLQAHDHEQEE